jgi:peptidoglycan hydrolase-like protein with peptidoglycan-binding domain
MDGLFGESELEYLHQFGVNTNTDGSLDLESLLFVQDSLDGLLSVGSRGENVALLQAALEVNLIDTGTVDGIFGRKTDAAVREFQSSHGLVVDGLVGPKTWERLWQTTQTIDRIVTSVPLASPTNSFEPVQDPEPTRDFEFAVPELDRDPAPNSTSDVNSGQPLLSVGSSGTAVETLQEDLVRHGHDLETDGIFGRLTEAAVKEFQVEHDLARDGIVGPKTWGALSGPDEIEPPEQSDPFVRPEHTDPPILEFGPVPVVSNELPDAVLGLGSSGLDVRTLQNALNEIGYDLVPDGQFGGQTEAAVLDFQEWKRLYVDGVAGPQTWAAMSDHLGQEFSDITYPVFTPQIDFDLIDPKDILNDPKMNPDFVHQLHLVIRDLVDDGHKPRLLHGFRSFEEQKAIPRQYTRAAGGESWHNYGLAADIGVQGSNPYPDNSPFWAALGEAAERHGLAWGGNGKTIVDRPHVEYHPDFRGTTFTGAGSFIDEYRAGGLISVWAAVGADQHGLGPIAPPEPNAIDELGSYENAIALLTSTTLGFGSTHPNVGTLQFMLKELGHYTGEIDADFGPLTEQAVKEFQNATDAIPDGVAGPITWHKLVDVYRAANPEGQIGEDSDGPDIFAWSDPILALFGQDGSGGEVEAVVQDASEPDAKWVAAGNARPAETWVPDTRWFRSALVSEPDSNGYIALPLPDGQFGPPEIVPVHKPELEILSGFVGGESADISMNTLRNEDGWRTSHIYRSNSSLYDSLGRSEFLSSFVASSAGVGGQAVAVGRYAYTGASIGEHGEIFLDAHAIGASFSALPTPYDPNNYGGAAGSGVEAIQILLQSTAMASNSVNLSHGLVEVETQINRDGEKRAVIRIGQVIILNGVPAAKTDYLASVGSDWEEHVLIPVRFAPASFSFDGNDHAHLYRSDTVVTNLPGYGPMIHEKDDPQTAQEVFQGTPYTAFDYNQYAEKKLAEGKTPRTPEDYIAIRTHFDTGRVRHEFDIDEILAIIDVNEPELQVWRNASLNTADDMRTFPDVMIVDVESESVAFFEFKTTDTARLSVAQHSFMEDPENATLTKAFADRLGLPSHVPLFRLFPGGIIFIERP